MSAVPPSPQQLGLHGTLRFAAAPDGKTFYYSKRRNEEHKGNLPVIESDWEDANRFRKVRGPFIYAVTDLSGAIRYIGKSWEQFLYQRWLRPQPFIHHRESRDHIIRDLRTGKGPLLMWSSSATELKVLVKRHLAMEDKIFVKALEALWLHRWGSALWNARDEELVSGFDDGSYWK
jgi:hypothetical protein